MEERKQIAVIGGDARQAAAGRALARAGYAVCGAEQVALADYILLPLPLDETRTPLAELLRAAKPGALALGGRLSAQAKQIAQEAGVELMDYFAREELTIREIAQQAALSPFYFQKGFAMLCGMTVGDYIRQRRLSAAGLEVQAAQRHIQIGQIQIQFIPGRLQNLQSDGRQVLGRHGAPPSLL